MMDVYREQLPDSYLLIVAPEFDPNDQHKLARGLHRASRSEKRLICVDCSLLTELPEDAIDLLLAYDFTLRCQHRQLVLCHLPQSATARFAQLPADEAPLVLPSLLDAHRLLQREG
ncbi:hypothetical protein FY528_08875 [Hymenobacter lutimineralis]|uniref:STAS domain-containing protein n=1 Tax=Hymenobacter lutimineralis TaxID=2606448 RepID=A0A5D6V6L9_9BACT|nr:MULTISPECIES: hypothetical protein [Hymenobacter]QIX63074.1 hypothetical protein HER32_18610 [Hymenobacter sp. BT18]TYZ10568.1 hypothetical protein FY528_08875 [Hymenobacter lutimineralis]